MQFIGPTYKKKAVNTPVNSISDVSREHLLDKFHKLHRLLKCETVETQGGKSISASRHPQGLMFCIEHLAAKFVRQGWEQVGSKPEAAFPLAAVIIALWHHHPQLGDLLLANFYEHCPYLLPYYVPKLQGQTDQEYYEALGYLYTNGQVEKQDKFLKRMAGITRLYAGLMVTPSQSGFHPFGINNAWTWLAEILQLDPRPDITATVLHEFLSVAGNALQMTYQRQFFKLIHVLCTEYLKRLVEVTPKGQGGPVTRLEHFLQQALRSQHFPPPEGMLPASFLII
ncbi:unnamed protein product [Darwinula stevensoni]|uniref:mRNA export factor GLE1 n=1 Tax=Darwinula stevensoni TaxID=69355 RepID=A0A7R8WYD2_9CRUS|nr:unnamed protein product [Darwinula stevensoni]CAG0879253.1 unnamed protein product [Darwinula stevensoni]